MFFTSVGVGRASCDVLGAIAMQSVRLSRATLGETVFVIGLGLVGQLVVALLRAAGCRVIGTDLEASKCELAIKMGAEVARPGLGPTDIEAATGGLGADAILIAASTESKGPMDLAAAAVWYRLQNASRDLRMGSLPNTRSSGTRFVVRFCDDSPTRRTLRSNVKRPSSWPFFMLPEIRPNGGSARKASPPQLRLRRR